MATIKYELTDFTLASVVARPSLVSKWIAPLRDAMREYEIDQRNRMAAFIAQVAHESGGFQWSRELWGPTSAQSRYEGRPDLGNTEPGDGYKFRGRGLIQTTGRANYARAAESLGLDLLNYPELLEVPVNAAKSACIFWIDKGLNEVSEPGTIESFREVTRKVNGGYNGWESRLAYWRKAQDALAVAYKE